MLVSAKLGLFVILLLLFGTLTVMIERTKELKEANLLLKHDIISLTTQLKVCQDQFSCSVLRERVGIIAPKVKKELEKDGIIR